MKPAIKDWHKYFLRRIFDRIYDDEDVSWKDFYDKYKKSDNSMSLDDYKDKINNNYSTEDSYYEDSYYEDSSNEADDVSDQLGLTIKEKIKSSEKSNCKHVEKEKSNCTHVETETVEQTMESKLSNYDFNKLFS